MFKGYTFQEKVDFWIHAPLGMLLILFITGMFVPPIGEWLMWITGP